MTVTGWGFTKDTDNGLTPKLRNVDVTTISNQECGQSYSNSIIDNGMMCTSSDNGKKGICKVNIFETKHNFYWMKLCLYHNRHPMFDAYGNLLVYYSRAAHQVI